MSRVHSGAIVSALVGLGLAVAAQVSGPTAPSVTPVTGVGAGRTLTLLHQDAADIARTEGLIATGTTANAAGACYFAIEGDRLWLRDDANSAWKGPVTAGSPAVLSNSQCNLAASGSSVARSGNSLAIVVTLTFGNGFVGPKTVYTRTIDLSGAASSGVPGGTWTVLPLNPGLDVITSSCADPSRDDRYGFESYTEQNGRVLTYRYTPECFPRYRMLSAMEGAFTDDNMPIPVMGRTCGHFNVLVAFVDTPANRRRLLDNTAIPNAVKAKISDGRVKEALTDLFATYTPAAAFVGGVSNAAKVIDFSFTIGLLNVDRHKVEWGDDGGLGFPNYDAALVLDDLSPASGNGVHPWPSLPGGRVMFLKRSDGGVVFNIDPFWITPGLFGNELMRRNMPTIMAEYQIGEATLQKIGNVTYNFTPIINPRTGENLGATAPPPPTGSPIPILAYMNGWGDVDHDGIIDCVDPEITPTADNVDGDFIPDRYDPDLRVNHRPYSWMYAPRGGRSIAPPAMSMSLCSAPPAAPNGLAAFSGLAGTVSLSWDAPFGHPSSYTLEAGSRFGATDLANSDLGSAATTRTLRGVAPATYYMRVRAKNACGISSPSNEIVVKATP